MLPERRPAHNQATFRPAGGLRARQSTRPLVLRGSAAPDKHLPVQSRGARLAR